MKKNIFGIFMLGVFWLLTFSLTLTNLQPGISMASGDLSLSLVERRSIIPSRGEVLAVVEIETKPIVVTPKKVQYQSNSSRDSKMENLKGVEADRITRVVSEDPIKNDQSPKTDQSLDQPGTESVDMEINHHPSMSSPGTVSKDSPNPRFIASASDRLILDQAQPSSENIERQIVSPRTSDLQMKDRTIELGTEIFYFRYKEPIFDLKDQGVMYGLYGVYTFRPRPGDYLSNKLFSMYKLDAKASYGRVDYESVSGTIDNIDDYMIEIRGLLGKDFYVGTKSLLTPFSGLGWRYLNDDTGGKQSSTGAHGYERESRYFYAPFGLEATEQLNSVWFLSLTGEYDLFISGQQTSHLSDVPGGYPDLKNKQRDGYGARGSLRLLHKGQEMNFLVEPFIRYWHIKDSDTATATGTGFIVTGLEPDNNSTEIGAKLGVEF